uniref:Protein DBF4 homolog A n=1 Tax=Gadus morhua TaxID=8049 RepID=A0A8C4Z984_GADMO
RALLDRDRYRDRDFYRDPLRPLQRVHEGREPTTSRIHHVCAKPLSGRVFYLDLPSNRRAQALENDITLLGGTVEKFFSKEIRYLVSNKREAKYVERLRRELAVPSPDSGPSSPFPRQTVHQPAGGQKVAKSRGKSLVERVVKEQERIQMNKTLSDALEWGVKVLYIDGKTSITLLKYVLKAYFSLCRHYRPIYAAMSKMPEINMAIAPPCTPFCGDKKDQHKNGHRAKKNRAKKQVGFCECCMLQYDNLIKHVQSESHRAFSKGNEYSVLDRLVSTMHCDLALFKPKNKRALPQYHKEFSQSGCSSRTFPHSHSLQKTVCESILGSPSERPEEEPLSQEQEKETCIPESRGIDLPDQRPSTVRTIQRKVKVQKRKRRRVDMGSGCRYQASSACDVPDEPLFGQLFQSSDSADLDFLGFDDGGREVFTP